MNSNSFALWAIASLTAAASAQVRITEFMYTGNGGEFVEITNIGPAPVNLDGWSIDDDSRTPGLFMLSALGILEPGESAIITESSAAIFRAQWGLDESVKVLGGLGPPGHNYGRNDEINIYNENNTRIDVLTYGDETFPGTVRARNASAWPTNESIGANRIDGWRLSVIGDVQESWTSSTGDVGSPGEHSLAGASAVQAPTFSHPAGPYDDAFTLIITGQHPDDIVHYTLDGSTPDENGTSLSESFVVGSRAGEPNDFSMIETAPPDAWVPPIGEVFKIVTVRAFATRPGALPSEVVTRSYIIGATGRYTLPIISICADRDDFWGYLRGIYVPGKVYDDQFDPGLPPHARPGNYTQEGVEWQRRAHFEFFETDGRLALSQPIAVRINGGVTTTLRQKSLRLYAGEYGGPPVFNHPIFGDAAPEVHKRLVLRNAGNDNSRAFCRDDVLQSLVAESGVDTQATRFAVVFINGEYWGVHSIRERHDKYLLHYTYGVDPDNIDFLEYYGLLPDNVREGDNVHYSQMIQFIRTANMSLDASVAELETRMDIDNYFTYFAAEIYSANYDWPNNNIRFWRERTPTGRWQWMLYDTDLGFGWGSLSLPNADSVTRLLAPSAVGAEIWRALLQNTGAKHRFLNRLADMLNREFRPDRVADRIEAFRSVLAPNMLEHTRRWSSPLNTTVWNGSLNTMLTFAAQRPNFVRQHIVNALNLAGMVNVTIDNSCTDCGDVAVNSIELDPGELPWSGANFAEVPITVRAVARNGYVCDGFDGVPDSQGDTATFVPIEGQVISPRFLPICRADYNQDGGIDGADVDAFYADWEAGLLASDINQDGGIDGADVDAFFSVWEAGGC